MKIISYTTVNIPNPNFVIFNPFYVDIYPLINESNPPVKSNKII